jgi:4'-phosphopantetheinyl transferase
MPLFEHKNIGKNSRLGLWKIAEPADQLLSQLRPELLNSSGSDKDKTNLHWLSSRLLLQSMLQPFPPGLYKDDFGKPCLTDPSWKISISHSGRYSGILISEDRENGIDIERVSDRILKVAHKFVNDKENAFIRKGDEIKMMHLLWSAKESLYKLYGRKELDFRRNLHVEPFTLEEEGSFEAVISVEGYMQELEVFYEFLDEYVLTWVVA